MKNHAVDNDYVQNLVEGLVSERSMFADHGTPPPVVPPKLAAGKKREPESPAARGKSMFADHGTPPPVVSSKLPPVKGVHLRKQASLDEESPRSLKRVDEVRGNEQATKDRIAKAAGKMTRTSQLNRSESRDGKSFLKKPEDVVQRPRTDGRPAKTPKEIGAQRGRIHRKLNARDEYNSTEHTEHQEAFNSGRKEAEEKVDENAEAGYPERGIKGGTAEAKAYSNRIAMKKKYKSKVEDKTRDRLAAAPALASIQQGSKK